MNQARSEEEEKERQERQRPGGWGKKTLNLNCKLVWEFFICSHALNLLILLKANQLIMQKSKILQNAMYFSVIIND